MKTGAVILARPVMKTIMTAAEITAAEAVMNNAAIFWDILIART